jgi:hypothetical protein
LRQCVRRGVQPSKVAAAASLRVASRRAFSTPAGGKEVRPSQPFSFQYCVRAGPMKVV